MMRGDSRISGITDLINLPWTKYPCTNTDQSIKNTDALIQANNDNGWVTKRNIHKTQENK